MLVHGGQPRHRGRGRGDTVVALVAGDDLLLQRSATCVVVVAHELERRVVRFRARVGEQHAAGLQGRRRRPGHQLGHQFGHRPGHLARERVVVGQQAHLPLGRRRQPRLGKTERGAPQPGHALEVAIAMLVDHEHAVAAHDHQGPLALELAQLGVGVQVVRDVAAPGGRNVCVRACHRRAGRVAIAPIMGRRRQAALAGKPADCRRGGQQPAAVRATTPAHLAARRSAAWRLPAPIHPLLTDRSLSAGVVKEPTWRTMQEAASAAA